jgi:hypothetical protein
MNLNNQLLSYYFKLQMCFDFSVNNRKNIEDGFLPYLSHDHLTPRVNMNNIESPANKRLVVLKGGRLFSSVILSQCI